MHGLAAMADGVFSRRRPSQPRDNAFTLRLEQRGRSQAAVALRGAEHLVAPDAVGDDGCIVGVAQPAPARSSGCRGGSFPPSGASRAALLRASDLGSPAKRCGQHARGAAQGVDAQAGVVGQRRQASEPAGVAGFGQGVFDKGVEGFFGFRDVPVRLGR